MSNNASFTPPSLLLSTIGLSLATFMQVLDTTIANVALPTISGNLGVSSEQGITAQSNDDTHGAVLLSKEVSGRLDPFVGASLLAKAMCQSTSMLNV